MLSKRLLTVAAFIKKGDIVLDVGTDHGYLPIYLRKEEISPQVIASDISENALASAKENVKKYGVDNIELIVSDGLEKITHKYDVLTISGMGTNTIIHILNGKKLPNKIILSSNNNLYELRCYMNKIGYKIIGEVISYDKGKYYDIISYVKGKEHLSYIKKLYGKSNDKQYFKYLLNKEKEIFKKVNLKNKLKKIFKLLVLKIKSI